jgi:arsenate reductase
VERKARKQKVLFLCTQNSARSQMAEALLRHHAGNQFEAYSAGCEAADEIHPYVDLVMAEVGIDTSKQHPKGLRTYMGQVGFNYSIVVCARAEKNCPKTFPGVGTRLVWAFDDPRGEDVPEEERLENFRDIRDEIQQRILDWLDHPEAELARLRDERERERRERLEAERREAMDRGASFAGPVGGRHSGTTYLVRPELCAS